MWDKILMIQLI